MILAECCSFLLLVFKWFWLLCCLAGLGLVSVDAHETNATLTTLPTSFIANRSRTLPYLRQPPTASATASIGEFQLQLVAPVALSMKASTGIRLWFVSWLTLCETFLAPTRLQHLLLLRLLWRQCDEVELI